jgi:hypothetical protein
LICWISWRVDKEAVNENKEKSTSQGSKMQRGWNIPSLKFGNKKLMQQAPSWIGVILVFAYFGFIIFWLPFANRRVEPTFRERIGRRMGVTIVRGTGIGKGLNWRIEGKKQTNRGCQIAMWEGMAVIGIFLMPVLLGLSLLGVILFVSSG